MRSPPPNKGGRSEKSPRAAGGSSESSSESLYAALWDKSKRFPSWLLAAGEREAGEGQVLSIKPFVAGEPLISGTLFLVNIGSCLLLPIRELVGVVCAGDIVIDGKIGFEKFEVYLTARLYLEYRIGWC